MTGSVAAASLCLTHSHHPHAGSCKSIPSRHPPPHLLCACGVVPGAGTAHGDPLPLSVHAAGARPRRQRPRGVCQQLQSVRHRGLVCYVCLAGPDAIALASRLAGEAVRAAEGDPGAGVAALAVLLARAAAAACEGVSGGHAAGAVSGSLSCTAALSACLRLLR